MEDVRGEIIKNETLEKFQEKKSDGKENPYIIIQPHDRVLPERYLKYHESIRDLEVYDDDVWVTTYPKSGL